MWHMHVSLVYSSHIGNRARDGRRVVDCCGILGYLTYRPSFFASIWDDLESDNILAP